MSDDTGPGKTKFIPNDDGSISLKRWNDAGWVTRFADAQDLQGNLAPSHIAHLLARAYHMGMDDKASLIKQAIGI
jgi:hypothetical protein